MQSYIDNADIGRPISLRDLGKSGYRIIVDGDSVGFFLHDASKLPHIFGGEYVDLMHFVDRFFGALQGASIELVVVYDGIPPDEKRGAIKGRRRTKCSSSLALWENICHNKTFVPSKIPVTRPGLLRNVMLEVLWRRGIRVVHAEAENDDLIVQMARDQPFDAVVAKDTDFLIYDIPGYIPVNHLDFEHMTARLITRNDICRHFRLQSKMLSLFAFLAGNDVTHGIPKATSMVRRLHQQMQPDVLCNLATFMQHKMDKIMNILLQDVDILEGVVVCYKKYCCVAPDQPSTIAHLAPADRHAYHNMTMDTEVALFLERRVRCFTGSFSGFHLCVPQKLVHCRANVYGLLTRETISEYFWTFDEDPAVPVWRKFTTIPNPAFHDQPRDVVSLLAGLLLPPTYLDNIDDIYWLPAIAVALVARILPNVVATTLVPLVYHVTCLGDYSLADVTRSCAGVPLQQEPLEVMDCYLSCLQEIIFFNQCLLRPIVHDRISSFFRGQLFYAFHQQLLPYEVPHPQAEQIIGNVVESKAC
jgi:hypothetical protein